MYHPNQRNQMNDWTPAERMIHDAVQEVEKMGANPLLTDAVILLGQARDKVGECVHNRLEKVSDPKRIRPL